MSFGRNLEFVFLGVSRYLSLQSFYFFGFFLEFHLVHAAFEFAFYLCFGIIEFADAFTETVHQFGYFFTAKQEKDDHNDDDQFHTSGHTYKQCHIHINLYFLNIHLKDIVRARGLHPYILFSGCCHGLKNISTFDGVIIAFNGLVFVVHILERTYEAPSMR